MGKREKPEIPMWAKIGHGKPITRREMLATGVIPFAAWAMAPSLSTLLFSPSRSLGADPTCDAGVGSNYIPFITLNLQGGPGLAGQVVVKNLSGGNLRSYKRLGLGVGPGISFNVEKEFGNVEFAGTGIGGNVTGFASKFLTGVRSPRNQANFRATALDKTAFVWNAVASGDDSGNNPLDITGYVVKMGLTGSMLPNLGRNDNATGIGAVPAGLPPPAPFIVGSVADLANALGYSSALKSLTSNQKGLLARLMSRLTTSQVERINVTPGATVISDALACAGIRNVDLVRSGAADVNPFLNTSVSNQLSTIWGVNAANPTGQNAVFAAMVYNGLTGQASTVNLSMGGYDYHDGTRTTGDQRDLAAGQVVGKILETAELLGKPVFIYVCADGATSSAESATADSAWVSDRGIAGMQYMLAYHPAKRPETTSFQIGGFNEGQAADGNFPTGNNAELAAQAVFANYAALNGRIDFLEQNRIMDASLRSQTIKMVKVA